MYTRTDRRPSTLICPRRPSLVELPPLREFQRRRVRGKNPVATVVVFAGFSFHPPFSSPINPPFTTMSCHHVTSDRLHAECASYVAGGRAGKKKKGIEKRKRRGSVSLCILSGGENGRGVCFKGGW